MPRPFLNKTQISVCIPDYLRDAIAERYNALNGSSISAVTTDLIMQGLAYPAAVKKAWSRQHIGVEKLGSKQWNSSTIQMDPKVKEQIIEHQKTYDLPRFSDALRELLRAGLGASQFEPIPVPQIKKSNVAVRPWIGYLSTRGLTKSAIAAELGVSRQYVNWVLNTGAAQ